MQIAGNSEGHVVEGRITLESVVNVAPVDRKLSKKKTFFCESRIPINRMISIDGVVNSDKQ